VHSSLELFKVDVAAGFSKLGSIDHTSLVSTNPTGYYCGYYSPQVRRGVFLENFVYSISYGGIIVKNADDMAAAGSTLPLTQPVANDGYGPSCSY
jgi:Beta propeller domain